MRDYLQVLFVDIVTGFVVDVAIGFVVGLIVRQVVFPGSTFSKNPKW